MPAGVAAATMPLQACAAYPGAEWQCCYNNHDPGSCMTGNKSHYSKCRHQKLPEDRLVGSKEIFDTSHSQQQVCANASPTG